MLESIKILQKKFNDFSISGSPDEFSFENRAFNLASFIGCFAGYLGLITNLLNQIDIKATIIAAMGGTFFAFCYYMSKRRKKFQKLFLPFIFFVLFTFSFSWIFNSGLSGAMPFYYFLTLFVFVIITPTHLLKKISIITIVNVLLLIFLEYNYPKIITRYPDFNTQFSDVATNLFVTIFLLAIGVILYKRNYDLEKQKVETQKDIIEVHNTAMAESIAYAHTIQNALISNLQELTDNFPNSFCLLRPRDVVSGDFYFFSDVDDLFVVAAVDCTGHGVPGAFMSLVANSLLKQIIEENKYTESNLILSELHKRIRQTLKQEQTGSHDGMDIALVIVDKKHKRIHYAGAHNPIYFFLDENQYLEEIKADKKSIGGSRKSENLEFTKHTIVYHKSISFYLFSDGYVDQFGGPFGRKYMHRKLKETLTRLQHLDMEEQGMSLHKEFVQWMGSTHQQMDDVLIIGVRIDV
jgi:serine phosphatase RsbU (regulator of sigma subunit)